MQSTKNTNDMFSAARGAKQWDSYYSGSVDSFEKYIFRSRCEYALDTLAKFCSTDSNVLDLGCGAGPFIAAALEQGYVNCIGMDYSGDILKKAVERLAGRQFEARLAQSNCEQIPIADQSLDMIVCLGVISYVPNREKALSEMNRILKSQGKLLITFRNFYNPIVYDPINLIRKLFGITAKSIRYEKKGDFVPGAFLKPRDVRKWLESSGFRIIDSKGIGRGPVKIKQKIIMPLAWSVTLDKVLERVLSVVRIGGKLHASDVAVFVCEKVDMVS